jgi:hypothetical protein
MIRMKDFSHLGKEKSYFICIPCFLITRLFGKILILVHVLQLIAW